jgi:IS1 family transposase
MMMIVCWLHLVPVQSNGTIVEETTEHLLPFCAFIFGKSCISGASHVCWMERDDFNHRSMIFQVSRKTRQFRRWITLGCT